MEFPCRLGRNNHLARCEDPAHDDGYIDEEFARQGFRVVAAQDVDGAFGSSLDVCRMLAL